MEKLESQMDVLKNEKTSLALKLEAASKASESENSRLKEENGKLKAQYRTGSARAFVASGPGVARLMIGPWSRKFSGSLICFGSAGRNTPRQTDIHDPAKINQVLREGQGYQAGQGR
jgi:hypothetical protein